MHDINLNGDKLTSTHTIGICYASSNVRL